MTEVKTTKKRSGKARVQRSLRIDVRIIAYYEKKSELEGVSINSLLNEALLKTLK